MKKANMLKDISAYWKSKGVINLQTASVEELQQFAKKIRLHVFKMIHDSKSSHIGSALSIVEILVTLYFKIMKIDPKNPLYIDRDKLILSKAHGSSALYATLVEKGFFPKSYLDRFYIDDGLLPGHLDKTSVPGIEYSLGALGHGLSAAIGMAISNKRWNRKGRIYTILGDGECNEGSVWEGIMFASHHSLDNLTAIVDYNKIQSFGRTNEVINQEPIADRWKAFGWDVIEVDGHNFTNLINAFEKPHSFPKVIIAHTIKGKGVSFMEDRLEWHYKSLDDKQYQLAISEVKKDN